MSLIEKSGEAHQPRRVATQPLLIYPIVVASYANSNGEISPCRIVVIRRAAAERSVMVAKNNPWKRVS